MVQLELPLDKVRMIPQKWVFKGQIRIMTVWEIDQRIKSEFKGLASMLAFEANEELQYARELLREILEHGGIRSSDFENIPPKYKRKSGRGLDEIACDMQLGSDEELYQKIQGAELIRDRLKEIAGPIEQRFLALVLISPALSQTQDRPEPLLLSSLE